MEENTDVVPFGVEVQYGSSPVLIHFAGTMTNEIRIS